MAGKNRLRVAMLAWEIGRAGTGFGTKIGGLGAVIEELPPELIKAAKKQGIDLQIEILSPCFAHYDKSRMTRLDLRPEVTLGSHTFNFEIYEHVFDDGQRATYFWDDFQLGWTNETSIYPADPWMALKLYSAVSQAMAHYVKQKKFDTIHLHDYHVGLVPFYLGDDYLQSVPVHVTIHNATYQGNTPVAGNGYGLLDFINLPGEKLFHRYFDFLDHLNLMKACMLKVYESGGRITTVSGDIEGTWGYAAELKESKAQILARAYRQKPNLSQEVFVPNNYLDLFEKLPVAGITNGVSENNRASNLPELKADTLRKIQLKRGKDRPIFANKTVQDEMLKTDHSFDADDLEGKARLKRLLHLEAFGTQPEWDPILFTVVGRLVEQKNLGLVADIMERTLIYDPGTRFIILASGQDDVGKRTEADFFHLALRHPGRVYFNNVFNQPLSRLILAGGDFCLIPSRFEPCGLVDYEAALVGNIPICRATGGLTKVGRCGYLYDWIDTGDRAGEANAFFAQIKAAIDTYRQNPKHHIEMVRAAMQIEAGWEKSAGRYLDMYRYGLIAEKWNAARRELIKKFIESLEDDKALFADFFSPGIREYADNFDWELKAMLTKSSRRDNG